MCFEYFPQWFIWNYTLIDYITKYFRPDICEWFHPAMMKNHFLFFLHI